MEANEAYDYSNFGGKSRIEAIIGQTWIRAPYLYKQIKQEPMIRIPNSVTFFPGFIYVSDINILELTKLFH
jgi:hypothetical protein